MFSTISTIASIIEISTRVYSGGRWSQKQIQAWKVPSSFGVTDRNFAISADYFSLTTDKGGWRRFKLGREALREEKRLLHEKTKLIEAYPGINENLLVDKRIGQMPYEVVTQKTKAAGLSVQNEKFQIPYAIQDVYDATHRSLIEHYRRVGIQYEPSTLVRVCNWDGNKIAVQPTEYTQAASTNLIADLDIEKALGKALPLDNHPGTTNTIRGYDLSLSSNEESYPDFNISALANPIGVAGIAITADNKLILTHRPRSVSTYAFKLGPSSSGYVTWHDLQSRNGDSLDSLLVTGLKREIAEELHLDLSHEISDLYPLVFYREHYRAGMPQGFYCFRINLTAERVVSRIRDGQDFRECIGIFSISVNQLALAKIIATLVRAQKVSTLDIGLEAQGLLTALALNGAGFLFS